MEVSRWAGLYNPGAWLALLLTGLLAGSIAVPFRRGLLNARIELAADAVAGLLVTASRDFVAGIEADDVPVLLARFAALAVRDGVDPAALQVLPPLPGTLLLLQGEHYLFHLASSPPDANAMVSPAAVPAYEVMAWPRLADGPLQSAYFHPDNAPRAYTRNLAAGYAGTGERRPLPGQSHRRSSGLFEVARAYRSSIDERWILY